MLLHRKLNLAFSAVKKSNTRTAMKSEKRIIIGQAEIAGMPISAPIKKEPVCLCDGAFFSWKKRKDGTFALVVGERGFLIETEIPFVE
jgi:hypothetical protein